MTLVDHLFALIFLIGFPVWGAWNATARNIVTFQAKGKTVANTVAIALG